MSSSVIHEGNGPGGDDENISLHFVRRDDDEFP